jgi:hypothetical protein
MASKTPDSWALGTVFAVDVSPSERTRILAALGRSAAGTPDSRPVYAAVSREVGRDRSMLRRWWGLLTDEQRAALMTPGAPVPKAPRAKPAASTAVAAEIAALLGRPEDDPLVTIGADLRSQRDGCESDTAKAQLTKELSRFLVLHRNTGGRVGPMTPDEHIARCREWVESTVEAILGSPDILGDPRVVAAVDALRAG